MVSVRAATFLSLLALALPARAGVVMEGRNSEGGAMGDSMKEPRTERFLIDGPKMRMEGMHGRHGHASALIVDSAAQKWVQVDDGAKTYMEMTAADMAQLRSMGAQMRARRGKSEAEPKDRSLKFEKTGRSDSDLGKSCDVYRVTGLGSHEQEMCLAPFGAFGLSKSDFEAFKGLGQMAEQATGVAQNWADFPGIPLIGWRTEGGERKETWRATKVEKTSVPASAFTVPAGYTKQPGIGEQLKRYQQLQQQKAPGGAQ